MTLLDHIRQKIADALTSRDAHQAELDTILSTVETEARDLNDIETTRFAEIRTAIVSVDADLAQLRARESELADIETRRQAAATLPRQTVTEITVKSEPRTYSRTTSRRDGISFVADAVAAQFSGDPTARGRLDRHMVEERTDRAGSDWERRDVGTGAFAGLTVPQYLVDMVAPAVAAMRPLADVANKHPLPAQGMTLNVSRITTATAAAIQATENAVVQETDIDDTLLTINVRTIAGQQDVSRQMFDRSTGADELIMEDLIRRYHTVLDGQIINADGTSGTHLGIRSTGSIIAVTYTDGSPTVPELYPKLFDLIQQIQSGVFVGISHFVMHPRRWWWISSSVGTSFPFVTPVNAGGPWTGGSSADNQRAYGSGPSGYIAGVPVIVDGNMLTTLGAGTEDVILGVTANELHLWEDASAPLQFRAEQITTPQSIRLAVWGYSAFTAGRYPGAHGTISGTGLAAPTF